MTKLVVALTKQEAADIIEGLGLDDNWKPTSIGGALTGMRIEEILWCFPPTGMGRRLSDNELDWISRAKMKVPL